MGQLVARAFRTEPCRVIVMGLPGGGKTMLLGALCELAYPHAPGRTIGFAVETFEAWNASFTVIDLGGQDKLRPLWRQYFALTHAVLLVVDATDSDALHALRPELESVLAEPTLTSRPSPARPVRMLVLVNKAGEPGALPSADVALTLGLNEQTPLDWHLARPATLPGAAQIVRDWVESDLQDRC